MITIHILPNISQSKGNQAIKFGQLIKYHERSVLLQKSCGKLDRQTIFRHLFVFYKALYEAKASGMHLNFNMFR